MINKDVIFNWNHEIKEGFKRIKQDIVEAPNLKSPNFDKEIILYTFASKTSYVAILA